MPAPARTSERGPWRVVWHAALDSTNRYALDMARAGADDGLVVVADVQTAGRGRLGRTWEAPPGASLLVTVLLPRSPHPHAVMAAGVALAQAVEQVAGIEVALKWPNDLLVRERKVAGLLAESDGDALVVGAGCNVNWDAFPPELVDRATACNLEAGVPVDRDALLDAYLDALDRTLAQGDGIRSEYAARLATIGRHVRVQRVRGHDLVGTAITVTDDGALVVRDDAGDDHTIVAGDVLHLR